MRLQLKEVIVMRKFLILLVALAIVLPAYSADTDQATSMLRGKYLYQFHAVNSDSGALNAADTSTAIPVFPNGKDWPLPDDILLYGVFTEIGSNTRGDTVIMSIETARTALSKANSGWVNINVAGTANGSNRTGETDTITIGLTAAESGAILYPISSTLKNNLLPYIRVRWDYGGAGSANDSMDVDWYVIYRYDND